MYSFFNVYLRKLEDQQIAKAYVSHLEENLEKYSRKSEKIAESFSRTSTRSLVEQEKEEKNLEKKVVNAIEEASNFIIQKRPLSSQQKHEIFKNDKNINEIIDQKAATSPLDQERRKEHTKALKKRVRDLRIQKKEDEAKELTIHAIRKETEKNV